MNRDMALACLYDGRGMCWLLSGLFQDKIDLLREELGPSVFEGLKKDRYYLLLTTQLEIIARVTGINYDFWYEGQEIVNHRRAMNDLSGRSHRAFKDIELQLTSPVILGEVEHDKTTLSVIKGRKMNTETNNQQGLCPCCSSVEIESSGPRTKYDCGSSDYDQRPGSFEQTQKCKEKMMNKTKELTTLGMVLNHYFNFEDSVFFKHFCEVSDINEIELQQILQGDISVVTPSIIYKLHKVTGVSAVVFRNLWNKQQFPNGHIFTDQEFTIPDDEFKDANCRLLNGCKLAGLNKNFVPDNKINTFEVWYLDLLKEIVKEGTAKDDRTGTGVISKSFVSYQHDLRKSFPQIRSRFLKPENPGKEMIWMLSGSNNEKDLAALGVPFWKEFADETGNLGPVYGYLWRHWPNGDGTETDQIKYIEDLLDNNPMSRRMVVNCWHPSYIPDSKTPPKENYKHGKQALTPCHFAWNVVCQPMDIKERLEWVRIYNPKLISFIYPATSKNWVYNTTQFMDENNVPKYNIDLTFIMRSNDTILGMPANFNMYAHLAHMLASRSNMVARYLNYAGTDVHVYSNHIDGFKQQLEFAKQNQELVFGECTQLEIINKHKSVTEFTPDDFIYHGYSKEMVGPAIRFPIAV